MKDAVVKREARTDAAQKSDSQRSAQPGNETRVFPRVKETSSTRIGMQAARITPPPTWTCVQCGCSLSKEMVVSGQAVLKEGALRCSACSQSPETRRKLRVVVFVGAAGAVALLLAGLLWQRHAIKVAELAALRADENQVERAISENRYLDAKAACTNVATGYQKFYDGNIPADVAARLESLRGAYEHWLAEHYGHLDTANTNTVEQVLRVLPGTTSGSRPRLLSYSVENNRAKLAAVSSPRPPLGENDPQPGSSLYHDPVLAEGNGVVAYVLQQDPSLEAVELEWNEPAEGGPKFVKNYCVTRAELPELLRASTPLAGSRQMNAARRP